MVKKFLAILAMAAALLGCVQGNTGPEGLSEGPNVGFDPVSQSPTTLAAGPGGPGG